MNLFWTAFLFGLVGSFHCIGMCGPIAMTISQKGGQASNFFLNRLFYNLGRTTVYTLLGVIFGLFGQTLQLFGLQQIVSVISGVLILAFIFLPKYFSHTNVIQQESNRLVHQVKQQLGKYLHKNTFKTNYLLGFFNGLLPCGLVYMAVIGAISQGSLIYSALYMAVFGLGTFPVFFVLFYSREMLSTSVKQFFSNYTQHITIIVACLFIVRGLGLGIPYLSPKMEVHEEKVEVSCCHKK